VAALRHINPYSVCHLSKQDTALANSEMYRVLKPQGLCFLSVISKDCWPKSLSGQKREPGEYWGEEREEEPTLHSMFSDEEADELVSAWKIVSKEKQVRYLREGEKRMLLLVQRSYKLLCLGLIAVLLAGVAWGLVSVPVASGDTVTVCAAGCDFTTIQDAIDDSGISAGDVINITDAVHTESGILVNKDVTIQGQGADSTVVQAHADVDEATERVFFVAAGTAATIRRMTIRHGNPSSEPRSGGGIRNEGELTIEESIISHNRGSAGGGIFNDGRLALVNCTVSSNTAAGGDSYLECSTGGGIKNMVGVATLINSTVSDNTARAKGGGLHIACQGTLVLVNSTVSGNNTTDDGGGVYLNGVGEFTNSTIVNNSAHNGGGVYVRGTREVGLVRGLLNYTNTIIADNTTSFVKYGTADCFLGDYASVGTNINNLVMDGSCDSAHSGDPRLAPLDDNGGDTQTHAPSPASPVVDAIPTDECIVDTDQRGMSRPYGPGCDIGAFELQVDESGIARYWVYGGLLVLLSIGGLVMAWRRRQRK
jgi:hypothetical protein